MALAFGLIPLVFIGFIAWLIYRVIKGRPFTIKAHHVIYGLACAAGVFTFGFFLSMDIPQLVKIIVSIFLGVILIIIAAYIQRHRQPSEK